MSDTCPDALLRHCHGTWIVHRDHFEVCTAEACTTPAEGHALLVLCSELLSECGCLPSEDDAVRG